MVLLARFSDLRAVILNKLYGKRSCLRQSQNRMLKANPVRLPTKIKFDDAMRRAMRVPPPPRGKKAKKNVWRKKRR
jgi:hypothetical protein